MWTGPRFVLSWKYICRFCLIALAVSLMPLFQVVGWAAEPTPEKSKLLFEKHVLPIFQARCAQCHGERNQKAELRLTDQASLERGGESGSLLVPGKPAESLLFEMISSGEMPPKKSKPLTKGEIETVRKWIEEGTHFTGGASSPEVITEYQVAPILLRRCTMCHGAENTRGDLDLRSRDKILTGGKGGPAMVLGDAAASSLVKRIESQQCPPAESISQAGIEPVTEPELKLLKEWIEAGAAVTPAAILDDLKGPDPLVSKKDRQFWSFQPPQRPSVPTIQGHHQVQNNIDRFLLAKLEAKGLSFSAPADRLALLRRATFDLLGLPPTPEQIESFLADDGPQAYEQMIDGLLASPEYGQRWARFWLDLAGYADSEGKRNVDTRRPFAYRWRDYVIRSFNEDKPYDQFLVEQLAGDELVDYGDASKLSADMIEKVVATGFLRMAPDGTLANPVNRVSDRVEVIADEIDVLGRSVMGLTLNCARCHSHKYDPLPQRDYYRLVAIFKGAYDEYEWMVPQGHNSQKSVGLLHYRYLELATEAERREIEQYNAPLDQEIAALEAKQVKLDSRKEKTQIKALTKQIVAVKAKRKPLPKVRALWDRGNPSPTYLYRRGDETQPGRPVEPGIPSMLAANSSAFKIEPPAHSTPKTGRRLAFARWLTQPDHPLTARVFVNRVWKQHFGEAIVKSSDDFGALGTPPSHPQLLDWLAVEFVEQGWSIKQLHRLIMTSQAYRQSSQIDEHHLKYDPENRLLSRMPMRRLDAEQVRDAMLFMGERLSSRPYGTPDGVLLRKDGLVTTVPSEYGWRRSIFVQQKRKELPTILETFDLPQMNPNCTRRIDSTVVSQPLFLLNNRLVHDWSLGFAQRIEREAGKDLVAQVERACLVAWGRPLEADERKVAAAGLARLIEQWREQPAGEETQDKKEGKSEKTERQLASPELLGLADFCQALFNTGEFLYVD